jgi:hypothetical protein
MVSRLTAAQEADGTWALPWAPVYSQHYFTTPHSSQQHDPTTPRRLQPTTPPSCQDQQRHENYTLSLVQMLMEHGMTWEQAQAEVAQLPPTHTPVTNLIDAEHSFALVHILRGQT